MTDPTPQANRQKHPRHQTLCSGRFCVGEQEVDCQVLDISVGGARVRLSQPVEPETLIQLKIDRIGEFAGRVAWRNGTTLGIEFHEELSEVARIVEDILSHDVSQDEHRGGIRTSVLWAGRILSAGRETGCRVLNISAHGAKIRSERPFDSAAEIILSIDRFGDFAAKVIWQDEGYLGVEFQDKPEQIVRAFGEAVPVLRQKAN